MPARAGSPARLLHEGNDWRETRAGSPARRTLPPVQNPTTAHSPRRQALSPPTVSLWVDDKSLRPVFAPQGRLGGCELGIASDGLLQQLDGGLIVLAIFQADVHQRAQVKVIGLGIRALRTSQSRLFFRRQLDLHCMDNVASHFTPSTCDGHTLFLRTELHLARPPPDLFVSPHATSQIDS